MPKNQRRPMWELKQTAAPDTLELYIYGDVEGEVWQGGLFDGEWTEGENSANRFREVLSQHPEATQINIYINSYGGDVFEGTAIYNQLRRHPAHKTVYVDAFACSIASVIAMAGDEVVMPRNSLMMIHNMWMSAVGSAAELRKAASDLDTINAAGREAYLSRAGDRLSEDRLIEMMDDETWLTARECIELGLADRLADQDADMSQAGEVLQKAGLALQQRIQFHRSLSAQLRELSREVPEFGVRKAPQAGPDDTGNNPENDTDPKTGAGPEQKNSPRTVMERLAAMTRKEGYT